MRPVRPHTWLPASSRTLDLACCLNTEILPLVNLQQLSADTFTASNQVSDVILQGQKDGLPSFATRKSTESSIARYDGTERDGSRSPPPPSLTIRSVRFMENVQLQEQE